ELPGRLLWTRLATTLGRRLRPQCRVPRDLHQRVEPGEVLADEGVGLLAEEHRHHADHVAAEREARTAVAGREVTDPRRRIGAATPPAAADVDPEHRAAGHPAEATRAEVLAF